MPSRKTWHPCRHRITRLRFGNHRGFMSLRRVGYVDIYCVSFRFCVDIWLRLPGLLLLVLCVVILIMVDSLSIGWCKFSRYLSVEGGKFGFVHNNSRQCRRHPLHHQWRLPPPSVYLLQDEPSVNAVH